MSEDGSVAENKNLPNGLGNEWIEIQQKTFTNWVNEQLSVSGRSIDNIETDFGDGVNLVSLVECLQLRKIGKITANPTKRIQKIQNVSLACKAITEDNVKLVNIGNEDIVNGNVKLILGLLWHLITRYQISSRKTKAPPKRLMLEWFRMSLPDVEIGNFTGDWNDGILLHALIDFLKPGTSPNWRELHSKNRVENCRTAMILAKEHLNIPRVISPEDFSSPALDELSAMTYLSYFVKVDSPGYYSTLNWICKQLRTTTITNLTTDWNDGYNLCAIVESLGANVPGFPELDRSNHVENCQKAIDGGVSLGVEPVLTAKELSDPNIDHLSVMTYLSRFKNIKPKKADNEKLQIKAHLDNLFTGIQTSFHLYVADRDVEKSKTKVIVQGPISRVDCDLNWADKMVECKFTPKESGEYSINVYYADTVIDGCPITFTVKADLSKVKILTQSGTCRVGSQNAIEVDASKLAKGSVTMEAKSPTGEIKQLQCNADKEKFFCIFQPKSIGIWYIHINVDGEEIDNSPISFDVYDPQKVWLSGPQRGIAGEVVVFTVDCTEAGNGSIKADVRHIGKAIPCDVTTNDDDIHNYEVKFTPNKCGIYFLYVKFNNHEIAGSCRSIDVVDPGQILVTGDGIVRGIIGKLARFQVNTADLGGNIKVNVEVKGCAVETDWKEITSSCYEFSYLPTQPGLYKVKVMWDDREVTGSPFSARIIDRSRVILIDDLTDLLDENGYLALDSNKETCLNYDTSQAGPGNLKAEVLAPSGKLTVAVRKPSQDHVQIAFTATEEGDHYVHLYWSDVPLDSSPILAYCPGPELPIDHTKVVVSGKGLQQARATVPVEIKVDGKKAGPGVPKVLVKGVKCSPEVEIKSIKYDRYKCTYTAPYPGGYLLYVYWSENLVPESPYKITVTNRGASNKVKVTGSGLKGGFVGQELRVVVDITEAGNGEITANCHGRLHGTRCDVIEQNDGLFTLRIFPTEASKQTLKILYDGENVPGSPFSIPVGEPPDPRKVKVYGPGVEDGLLQTFESKFIVETYGAGAGQLAIRIRGPRDAFKVEMQREAKNDRTILCNYDPSEPGEYVINIKWSGYHVRGSPFRIKILESREELKDYLQQNSGININSRTSNTVEWREEI